MFKSKFGVNKLLVFTKTLNKDTPTLKTGKTFWNFYTTHIIQITVVAFCRLLPPVARSNTFWCKSATQSFFHTPERPVEFLFVACYEKGTSFKTLEMAKSLGTPGNLDSHARNVANLRDRTSAVDSEHILMAGG